MGENRLFEGDTKCGGCEEGGRVGCGWDCGF